VVSCEHGEKFLGFIKQEIVSQARLCLTALKKPENFKNSVIAQLFIDVMFSGAKWPKLVQKHAILRVL
jgi:hypothetical protein